MDPALVVRINRVFRGIITNAEVRSFVETRQAAEVVAGTPAEFAALVAGDIAKWGPVIREGNIRAE
jgi:tripartite-type tricarboxylate transporter receptor subunit TctC